MFRQQEERTDSPFKSSIEQHKVRLTSSDYGSLLLGL